MVDSFTILYDLSKDYNVHNLTLDDRITFIFEYMQCINLIDAPDQYPQSPLEKHKIMRELNGVEIDGRFKGVSRHNAIVYIDYAQIKRNILINKIIDG